MKLMTPHVSELPASKPHISLPRIISFFSGAGGLDLGFKEVGFSVDFATDIMQASQETHQLAFAKTAFWRTNIEDVSEEDFLQQLAQSIDPGQVVGIIGGPPCQGFSRSNPNALPTDPRNALTQTYGRLVTAISRLYTVDFVLFENVMGILDAKNKPILDRLLAELSDVGLSVSVNRFDAINFGVPQRRKRVIVFASRHNSVLVEPSSTPQMTVRTAIENLQEPRYYSRQPSTNDEFHPNHWAMNPRSSKFQNNCSNQSGRSFRKLKWDEPSPTVAMGHREMPVHPEGHRRISVLEAMLLQGFPQSYEVKGSFSDQVTQVSNAVPPPLARALASQIRATYE